MTTSSSHWFVGAAFNGGSNDQTQRFLKEGIWENGYPDRHLGTVKSMQVGDRIAIKAAYTRKKDLSFETHGRTVSVLGIKAIGTITENPQDGRRVKVQWDPTFEPKSWYFYTNRSVIWKVVIKDWMTQGLIDFAFHDGQQDINRFRNAPYWQQRFGDAVLVKQRFEWTTFYEEFADKLLAHKQDRTQLVNALHELSKEVPRLTILNDQPSKGVVKPLEDICPFTVFALFNRSITNTNRMAIAGALAKFLKVETPVPSSFDGIPAANNQQTWFFGYQYRRAANDIDALWQVFEDAINYSNDEDLTDADKVKLSFSQAAKCYGTGWNLTMGLYWIRPWRFLTLDGPSRTYVEKQLSLPIGKSGNDKRISADEYFELMAELEQRFQEDGYPVHSFPELSLTAGSNADGTLTALNSDEVLEDVGGEEGPEGLDMTDSKQNETVVPYGINEIIIDGCFLDESELEEMLTHIRRKRNLILQGPPGTGKTWLAKRLAYALIGSKKNSSLKAVQFHPNLSYEDFIRGFRPAGEGTLQLVDGPFLDMINRAIKDSANDYVFVIEEINRGNPAQIFGEMLTLLEADKRTPSEALELSYRKEKDEKVHIPDNLFVIGTMNIADRSLALVDLALRRRFAFFDLEPKLGEEWQKWMSKHASIDKSVLDAIKQGIDELNNSIADDPSLGPQFKIGHSYVTANDKIDDAKTWFSQVVKYEIRPLLQEYWFDDPLKAEKAVEALLAVMDGKGQ